MSDIKEITPTHVHRAQLSFAATYRGPGNVQKQLDTISQHAAPGGDGAARAGGDEDDDRKKNKAYRESGISFV
eukprot:7397229-Pyramimonas_sp.AAC.1